MRRLDHITERTVLFLNRHSDATVGLACLLMFAGIVLSL